MSTSTTTVFIDQVGDLEKSYFSMFPAFPIKPGKQSDPFLNNVYYDTNVRIDQVHVLKKMDLLSLCKEIVVKGMIPGNVMIICHGNEHGMKLPLVPGGETMSIGTDNSDHDVIKYLLNKNAVGSNVGLDHEKQFKPLQEWIARVHHKKINHIIFGACSVGMHRRNVERTTQLFGARTGTAPKMRVFCAPTAKPRLARNSSEFSSGWIVYNESPHRIGFKTAGGEIGNPVMTITDVLVESKEALEEFVDNYFSNAVKKVKIKGPKKNMTYTEEKDIVFTEKDRLKVYYMWDQSRMHFVRSGQFSQALTYVENPKAGFDPFTLFTKTR